MRRKTILLLTFLCITNCFGQKQKDEPISYKDDLSFQWKKEADTLKFVAKNKLFTPIEIFFTLKKSKEETASFLVQPKDSLVLVTYKGVQPDSVFKIRLFDSIAMHYYFGHKSLSKPDNNYLYRFPFKKRKKYEVSQSFNGKFSHKSTQSKYAIDFQLNVGEPVYAAREGTVVKVIDWFTKQGGKELIHAANKIIILHTDGTFASYVHLNYKGSFVKEGDLVKRGQKIGVSGLTGFTRGPHLHFVVRKERDISIPIYFTGHPNKILRKGKKYKVMK